MYEYILGMIESFIKHGLSPTAFVMALIAFFRTKYFKRFLGRRAPGFFRDDADVLSYQERQIRIEQKIDEIAAHVGVDPAWPINAGTSRESSDLTNSTRAFFLFSSKALSYVRAVVDRGMSSFIKLINLRRMLQMKKKLSSRKFILAIVSAVIVIANDGLDLGIQSDTVMTFAGLVATWIIGESAVDMKRNSSASDVEKSYHGE